MKIIQLNAWLGRVNGPLVRFLQQESADIVCLQEAYMPNKNMLSAFADQYNFLDQIRATGLYPYEHFAKNWAVPVGGALMQEGDMILSKYPISCAQQQHISGHYHERHTAADTIANTRVWQACQIAINGKQLSVANHQAYITGTDSMGDATTATKMEKVAQLINTLPRPLIFCGDLNINPKSPALKMLDQCGLRNLTVEHKLPTTLSSLHRAPLPDRNQVACDYILTSPDIVVKSFYASDELVSDHKALILNFELA